MVSIAAASGLALAALMLVVWLSRINVQLDAINRDAEPVTGGTAGAPDDCESYDGAIRLGFPADNLPAPLFCERTIANLLNNPDRYEGALVVIDGEFGAPFEGSYVADTSSESRLWLSLADNPYSDQCRLSGQLRGIFRTGPSGHLGLYDGELSVLNVDRVDDSQAYPCGLAGPASRPPRVELE